MPLFPSFIIPYFYYFLSNFIAKEAPKFGTPFWLENIYQIKYLSAYLVFVDVEDAVTAFAAD